MPFLKKLLCILTFFLVYVYVDYQLENYRVWVKVSSINSYDACRIFNEGELGEQKCMEYAKDPNLYSPFPLGKSLIFINPNAESLKK